MSLAAKPGMSAASVNSTIAITRLTEERKQWRKDHPFLDGSMDMMVWDCGIPGKEGGIWAGGVYPLTITFSNDYPALAPKVVFTPPLPHPNIFASGAVCLSILSYGWKPTIGVKQILLGVQELLDEPNPKSPANHEAYSLYKSSKKAYEDRVKAYAAKCRPVEETSDVTIL